MAIDEIGDQTPVKAAQRAHQAALRLTFGRLAIEQEAEPSAPWELWVERFGFGVVSELPEGLGPLAGARRRTNPSAEPARPR